MYSSRVDKVIEYERRKKQPKPVETNIVDPEKEEKAQIINEIYKSLHTVDRRNYHDLQKIPKYILLIFKEKANTIKPYFYNNDFLNLFIARNLGCFTSVASSVRNDPEILDKILMNGGQFINLLKSKSRLIEILKLKSEEGVYFFDVLSSNRTAIDFISNNINSFFDYNTMDHNGVAKIDTIIKNPNILNYLIRDIQWFSIDDIPFWTAIGEYPIILEKCRYGDWFVNLLTQNSCDFIIRASGVFGVLCNEFNFTRLISKDNSEFLNKLIPYLNSQIDQIDFVRFIFSAPQLLFSRIETMLKVLSIMASDEIISKIIYLENPFFYFFAEHFDMLESFKNLDLEHKNMILSCLMIDDFSKIVLSFPRYLGELLIAAKEKCKLGEILRVVQSRINEEESSVGISSLVSKYEALGQISKEKGDEFWKNGY